MAGLLNPNSQQAPEPAAPAQGAPSQGGAETLNDPVLQQIEQGIEDKVPAEMKDAYLAIVVAGMQIMFSKETSKLVDQSLDMPGDLMANVAQGISKLMILIYNESKKNGGEGMEVRMSVPAAITLMCQALDYVESTRGTKVTPEMAAECTKQTMTATLKAFGITEDQVNQTIQAGQQQGGGAAPADAGAEAPQQPMEA
jgi:hypothetical protein